MKTRRVVAAAIIVLVLALGWNATKPLDAVSTWFKDFRGPDPAIILSAAVVGRVIDGDTIALTDGSRVRIAGIDTPERGKCGYADSTNLMRTLIGDEPVLVTLPDKGTDRYGRLLGYVDTANGIDAGLAQIESGLAVARYDSSDGYGPHPRENDYVKADAQTAHVCPGWD